MLAIRSKFTMEYAHSLDGEIYGKCQRLHGHRGEMEVEVTGELKDGMIMNFTEMKSLVNGAVVEHLDHHLANEMVKVPTAENLLIEWIVPTLQTIFGDNLLMVSFKETEKNIAIWRK